ncbi:uncharacterized protein EV420DRAFT_1168020 [Desarmillaria tabescens]|uniref:Uncharacterized protein n=1 Tax=Armillaria tabescens TaxID=1929756 RepID=A0AA39MN27_ARMTA|nr:uncharacterized protein EV420DRAFT_1168020 [Desarmillaria tabescens]KAK0439953.1 hypothetical protein EV420DRAFT_1168020 [Desarmillaria tabescens]
MFPFVVFAMIIGGFDARLEGQLRLTSIILVKKVMVFLYNYINNLFLRTMADHCQDNASQSIAGPRSAMQLSQKTTKAM